MSCHVPAMRRAARLASPVGSCWLAFSVVLAHPPHAMHTCWWRAWPLAAALVISGFLDLLTPAYQSFEMTGRMPNAWHVCHIFGTHFLLCE